MFHINDVLLGDLFYLTHAVIPPLSETTSWFLLCPALYHTACKEETAMSENVITQLKKYAIFQSFFTIWIDYLAFLTQTKRFPENAITLAQRK